MRFSSVTKCAVLSRMIRIKVKRETCIPWSSRCDKIRRPRNSRTSLEQIKNRCGFCFFFFFFFPRCMRKHMGWVEEGRESISFSKFSPDTKQTRVLRCVNREREKDPPLWWRMRVYTSKFESLQTSLPPFSFREKRNGPRNYYYYIAWKITR